MHPDELAQALTREREAFLEALEASGPDALGVPALVGEWSARELVAHLGYWAGHAAELIHAAESGRVADTADERSVDEINETVAKIARQTSLATVRRREAASVEALLQRLRALDPALLEERLPDGSTLAEGIREDASAHYAEHAAALRQAIEGGSDA
jgi:hypothetical protein